ncbi:MAG: hypothetical protein IPL53_09490 [Ignavibacteria bacterium]|nr:hypothetical protein [Ignavibacteria bacterium]
MTIYLRSFSSPYELIDSSKSTIDSLNFSGIFKFNSAIQNNYYIVSKSSSTLETWSKEGGFLRN